MYMNNLCEIWTARSSNGIISFKAYIFLNNDPTKKIQVVSRKILDEKHGERRREELTEEFARSI